MNFTQFAFYIFKVFTAFLTPVHWRVLITKTDKRDPEDDTVFRDQEELSFYDFIDRLAQQTGVTSRVSQAALIVNKYKFDRLYNHEDVRNSSFYADEPLLFEIFVWYTHIFTKMEIAKIYDDDHHKIYDFTDELNDNWYFKSEFKWTVNEAECAAYFAQDYDPNNEYENYSDYDDEPEDWSEDYAYY